MFNYTSMSHRSETESNDSQVIVDISHKIINEILNDPPQLQNELDCINRSIQESSFLIKNKISQLLATSTKKLENPMVNQSDNLQEQLRILDDSLNKLQLKYQTIQATQQDLDMEEKRLQQLQFISICLTQEQLDRQQNESYDFYETEFNKMKENYDVLSRDQEDKFNLKEEMKQQYSALLESKAMLKEDLNGRLLQRAELVAQKEEQEELIDHYLQQDSQLLQFGEKKALLIQQSNDIASRLSDIEITLVQHKTAQEVNKQLASKHNQLQQYETQLYQNGVKIKTNKNKLLSTQKSLNLPHPDTLLNECIQRYASDVIRFMTNLRATTLRQSGHKWSSTNEYMALVEQYIQQSIQNKTLQVKVNELKSHLGRDYSKVQDDIYKSEFQQEGFKQEMNLILEQKTISSKDLQQLQNQFNSKIQQLTEKPFSHYVQQNEQQLNIIRQKYGQEEYDSMLRDNRQQFFEIIEQQETQKLKNVVRLMESYKYLERVIKINIDAVDECILPDLKESMQQIDTQRDQVKYEVDDHDMKNVEQEIFYLEQQFSIKIQHFQERDEQLNLRMKEIAKEKTQASYQIEILEHQMKAFQRDSYELTQHSKMIEDGLHSQDYQHKSRLEQEIVDLNSTLMNQQHKKKRIEAVLQGINFIQSPIKNNSKLSQSPVTGQISIVSRRSSGNIMKDNRSPVSRSMNGHNIQKLIQKRQGGAIGTENSRMGAINQSTVPSQGSYTPGKFETQTKSTTNSISKLNRFWQSPNYIKK